MKLLVLLLALAGSVWKEIEMLAVGLLAAFLRGMVRQRTLQKVQ